MKTITQPKVDHQPAVLDDASKLLLKAAAYLESKGWRCGSGDSGVCAYEAIVYADKPDAIQTPLATVAAERLAAALGCSEITGIFKWNDARGRTKDEVIAKLRAVALRGE